MERNRLLHLKLLSLKRGLVKLRFSHTIRDEHVTIPLILIMNAKKIESSSFLYTHATFHKSEECGTIIKFSLAVQYVPGLIPGTGQRDSVSGGHTIH